MAEPRYKPKEHDLGWAVWDRIGNCWADLPNEFNNVSWQRAAYLADGLNRTEKEADDA